MKKNILIILLIFISSNAISQIDCEDTKYINDIGEALIYPECVYELYLENEEIIEDTMLRFTNLRSITLINCNGKNFLQYAWKFKKLEGITIQYNIDKIPRSIGKCNNLVGLTIFNSKIEKIPKTIEM